ncbi:hypothetical protein [Porphyrobacter sp. YT40]|uniref:hypothetical protein n=1 Tax=Porphyrobacter sp. YT40 TaxID=2547601 RepID=UPI001141DE4B|nr:hypothetical protein [Porphyrobacter sp. YT40]QDH33337.1 hypothetical protein E2E27_02695 [Porphyrobacter sp. YT40]
MTGEGHRTARWSFALLCVLAVAALFPSAAEALPQSAAAPVHAPPDSDEIGSGEGLDLRIAEIRLRERRVLAADALLFMAEDGAVYVPFAALMDALGFALELDDNGRMSGWFLRETQRFAIDLPAGTADIGGAVRAVTDRDMIRIDGEAHISAGAMQDWFRLSPTWDASRQTLNLAPPYLLASEEAARRAGQRVAGSGATSIDTTGFVEIAQNHRWIGWPHLTTNLALSADNRQGGVAVQGSLLAQGDILKATGFLALNAATSGETTARFTLERRDPLARQLGPLGASLIEAGDIAAPPTPLLQQSAFGVGFRIAREPLDQAGTFATTSLIGDAPPGWQAELYRDDELLDFQTIGADGRYAFPETPTRFGINRFRIVLYGPSGERQTIERVTDIGSSLVQPGALRYNLLMLREGRTLLDGRTASIFFDTAPDHSNPEGIRLPDRRGVGLGEALYTEARAAYGISGNLGVSTLAAYRRPDNGGPDSFNLGAGISVQTGRAVYGGEVVMQNGEALAGRAFGGLSLGAFDLSASHERYSPGFSRSPNDLGNLGIASQSRLALNGRIGAVGVGMDAVSSTRVTGESDRQASVRVNAAISGISLSSRLSYRLFERSAGGRDGDGQFAGGLLAAGSLGPFRLRAGLDYEVEPRTRLRRALGEVTYRAADWQLTAFGERDLVGGGGQWGLGASRDWNGVRLGADLRHDNRTGGWRGFLTLSFAVDRAPLSGGLRFGREALSARGAVVASAFADTNGNRLRDEGEPEVENVNVELVPRGLVSHDGSRVLVENLPVDGQLALVPDLENVDDPYLVLADKGYVFTTRPGAPVALDIPVIESGELAVSVLGSDGSPTANMVAILRQCEADAPVARERTAFDGKAFFLGLAPGCYELSAGPSAAVVEIAAGEVHEASLVIE